MSRSKVEALLSQSPRGDRVATSVKLDKGVWEGAQAFCRERGISPSELVEALLEDLLAAQTRSTQPAQRGRPRRTGEVRA